MSGSLISPTARRPVLALIVLAAALVVALAAVVWHGTTTSFDSWAFRQGFLHFGGLYSDRRRAWLLFSEPALSFAVPAVVAVVAVVRRRWDVAVLAVAGPAVALGITELIGKPLVARVLGPFVLQGSTAGSVTGSYPSGHETGMVSWLVVLLVLVFRSAPAARWRAAALALALLWTLGGAVGLTVNYFHYATDTIGAIGVATAVVLGLALTIDAATTRLRRRAEPAPSARSPQFT